MVLHVQLSCFFIVFLSFLSTVNSNLGNKVDKNAFKKANIQVNLAQVTWTKTNGGIYYTNVDVSHVDYSMLLSFNYGGTWYVRETDMLFPSLSVSSTDERVLLFSNTNSFAASNSYFYGTLLYI